MRKKTIEEPPTSSPACEVISNTSEPTGGAVGSAASGCAESEMVEVHEVSVINVSAEDFDSDEQNNEDLLCSEEQEMQDNHQNILQEDSNILQENGQIDCGLEQVSSVPSSLVVKSILPAPTEKNKITLTGIEKRIDLTSEIMDSRTTLADQTSLKRSDTPATKPNKELSQMKMKKRHLTTDKSPKNTVESSPKPLVQTVCVDMGSIAKRLSAASGMANSSEAGKCFRAKINPEANKDAESELRREIR